MSMSIRNVELAAKGPGGGGGERKKKGENIFYALDAPHILFQLMVMATLVLLTFCKCNSEGLDKLAPVKELLSEISWNQRLDLPDSKVLTLSIILLLLQASCCSRQDESATQTQSIIPRTTREALEA